MRLENKVALVTGANSGIGCATTELFAEQGAVVYAADLRERAWGSPRIRSVVLDVTSADSWRAAVDLVLADAGRIDVLVNNAGTVSYYQGITDITPEQWNEVVAVNQTGPFLGMREVIPAMRRGRGGSIVNISSIWGISGVAGVAPYTASKNAVRGMSKNAALTYVDDGIRVNSLHPGIVDTPMVARQDADITAAVVGATPMKRCGKPREIAYGALFLASDESSYMTGAELVIDGGYTAP